MEAGLGTQTFLWPHTFVFGPRATSRDQGAELSRSTMIPQMTVAAKAFWFLQCGRVQLHLSASSVLCLMHTTGLPPGMAVSHCITWFPTQVILTMCQIRYHQPHLTANALPL